MVVEGSAKSLKQYNRLMLVRIKWTEAAREKDEVGGDDDEEPVVKREEGANGFGSGPKSLDDNTCDKVWEGPLRDRVFKNFKGKSCPTDSTAKEVLGGKMASVWDVAKAFIREEDL